MFNNIGKKIKTLAKVLFWVCAISFTISGLLLFTSGLSLLNAPSIPGYSYTSLSSGVASMFLGLLTIGLGFLIAWVGNFMLYGFGELIDKTHENEKNTRAILNILNTMLIRQNNDITGTKDNNANTSQNDTNTCVHENAILQNATVEANEDNTNENGIDDTVDKQELPGSTSGEINDDI